MTTEHIKVYKASGSWIAECPCNAYRKSTLASSVHDWAIEHRDEHRAAFHPLLAPTDALDVVDVTVEATPADPSTLFLQIDLAPVAAGAGR
ncbi:hypothetical protein [Glycomyces sp. YM15]|uniref:hypothetical protein n=1 Tax=Glycomyces sp. YM15 TaxID=2800446 RepID=UPI00196333B8|nr:hypothetical protein [Glycomyces sp. YM15]